MTRIDLSNSIDFLIQARMSSNRLPNKVLLNLKGNPVLYHVWSRVSKSKYARRVAVLTSTGAEDDAIEKVCAQHNIECFRGSLDDVLDRYYRASLFFKSRHLGRITADCPCIDPNLLDALVEFYYEGKFDYASNAAEPTLPDGFDAEIFSFKTLEIMWKNATLQFQREHVTQYLYQNPEKFKIGSWKAPEDNSKVRVTLDTEQDYKVISRIYDALYSPSSVFTLSDVLHFLRNNEGIQAVNSHLERNASLKAQMKEQLGSASTKQDVK